MCISVTVEKRELTTPRELAVLVGGEQKLEWLSDAPRDLDLCLCSVDVKKTLTKGGFIWRQADDPMELFLD